MAWSHSSRIGRTFASPDSQPLQSGGDRAYACSDSPLYSLISLLSPSLAAYLPAETLLRKTLDSQHRKLFRALLQKNFWCAACVARFFRLNRRTFWVCRRTNFSRLCFSAYELCANSLEFTCSPDIGSRPFNFWTELL
ncbi:hypothetical protein CEXT_674511 [Caerostris extrusa]|uniref:Uncharacterized protein n=1 Tax=Caerostris extrusa TaxID=172846 RepID=A0AAV4S9L2_CAEEX|nr:hypothetical protein CEXT_674511 [Caerostris extrusa]